MTAAVSLASLAPTVAAQRGGPPACPDNVLAMTQDDGILLTWDYHLPAGERDAAGESEFKVYRADGSDVDPDEERFGEDQYVENDERFTLIATLDADTTEEYLDANVVEGEVYAYIVTFDDGVESGNCDIVEATAIPFFGAPLLGALALAGCVGAYAYARRK